jgi:hypothetical protein
VPASDQIVRRRTPAGRDDGSGPTRQPATRVHVDYTAASGLRRVGDLTAEIAEDVRRSRRLVRS